MKIKKIMFAAPFLMSPGLEPKTMMAMFEALPKDFKIVGWGTCYEKYASYWIVKSEEFDSVPDGQMVPELILEFTKDGDYLRCSIKKGDE